MKHRETEILRDKARRLEVLARLLTTVANIKNLDIIDVDGFDKSLDLCKLSK